MRLRQKSFEKRLWSHLKEHDLRRQMNFWRKVRLLLEHPVQWPVWLARSVLSGFIIIGLILNRASVASEPELWLAAMSLWGLLVAQTNAGIILRSSATDPHYRTLWLLPLSADQIYRCVLRRVWLGSAWLLAEFLVLYGLAGATWIQSLICGLSQAVVAIALVTLISGFRLTSEPGMMAGVLFAVVTGITLVTGSKEVRHIIALFLNIAHPLGWVHAIYVDGMTWWRIIPPLALLAFVPASLKRLRRLNAQGALREERNASPGSARVEKPQSQLAIEDSARRPVEWTNAGSIERLLSRLLTPHERLVAEMLLIKGPQWSRIFYALLSYAAMFLVANSFIRFQSGDEILRAVTMNFDDRVVEAIVASVLCLVFLYIGFLRGATFFGWHASPEWLAIRSKNTTSNPFFAFRLFPISYWDTVRVVTKVNSALFLILLPVAIVVSQAPFFQMLVPHRNTLALLPKCLTFIWAAAALLASLKLIPCTENLRYWRALLAVIMVWSVVCGFALAFVLSPGFVTDIVLMALLVIITLGWVTYWGFRYSRGVQYGVLH